MPISKRQSHLHIVSPNGLRHEITAIIDTGYNGALTLPHATVLAFALMPSASRMVTLGDASQRVLDFYVGVTFLWVRSRRGPWRLWGKTRRASFRRAKTSLSDGCRRHRHVSIKEQHAALSRRWRGHVNSWGVSGNVRSVLRLVEATKRA